MKLFNSKKAIGVDDLFPLLFIIIAFVVIILLFTYSKSKEEGQVNTDVFKIRGEIDTYNVLYEFLSKEIYLDLNEGYSNLPADIKTMTVEEYISYYYSEEDSNNKENHYSRLLLYMQDFFNPLEYCYLHPDGIKVKKGYMIFITEDPTESWQGTSLKTSRKFASESFDQYLVGNKIIYPLPLPDYRILYIIFMESSIYAKQDKSCTLK